MARLLFNATIYVSRETRARHLYINDAGLIEALDDEALRLADAHPHTTREDAQGAFITPGFNDSHLHLLMKGEAMDDIELLGCTSIEEVKARCHAYIEARQPAPGTILHGMGWNQDYFTDEKRLLTKDDLDAITTEHKLILERACSHILTMNSLMLEHAGISRESTPVPGGAIDKDLHGHPNGIVRENSAWGILGMIPPRDVEGIKSALRMAMRYAAQRGITSMQTMDMRPKTWQKVWQAYEEVQHDSPTCRITHQVNFMREEDFQAFLDAGFHYGVGDLYNRIGPLKMFVDGSLGARTAQLRAPYHDDPSTSGIDTMPDAQLDRMVRLAERYQTPAIMHAIGDRAIERVLDCYRRVGTPGNPLRHGVVHVQITDKPLLERFQKERIMAYTQPIFLHYDCHMCEDRVGHELASTSYAFGTLAKLGVHQALGTDCPIEDLNVLDNLYCAINRRSLNNHPSQGWFMQEAMSLNDAIHAYTYESAYVEGLEHIKGVLKPGYVADLVAFDQNLFDMDPLAIREARILGTMMGGRWVFGGLS